MTTAVEHMSGVRMTKVPKTSRYRFFILKSRNVLSGRNITKITAPGNSVITQAANTVIIEVVKSKRFHPEFKYLCGPKLKIFVRASNKNTEIEINLLSIFQNFSKFIIILKQKKFQTYIHQIVKYPNRLQTHE